MELIAIHIYKEQIPDCSFMTSFSENKWVFILQKMVGYNIAKIETVKLMRLENSGSVYHYFFPLFQFHAVNMYIGIESDNLLLVKTGR